MKILEFLYKDSLAPIGGPLGYVYSLYKQDEHHKNLWFLEKSDSDKRFVKNNSKRKNRLLQIIITQISYVKLLFFGSKNSLIEKNEFDLIHFHSTFDLYKYRKSLKNIKA